MQCFLPEHRSEFWRNKKFPTSFSRISWRIWLSPGILLACFESQLICGHIIWQTKATFFAVDHFGGICFWPQVCAEQIVRWKNAFGCVFRVCRGAVKATDTRFLVVIFFQAAIVLMKKLGGLSAGFKILLAFLKELLEVECPRRWFILLFWAKHLPSTYHGPVLGPSEGCRVVIFSRSRKEKK